MVKNKAGLALALILFASFIMVLQEAHAFKFSKETCKKYNLGSNWYCEEEKQTFASPEEIMERDVPPEYKALLLNQLWEIQQKRAVITRKKEDLESVLKTQKHIAYLSADYALKMIRLTESTPEHSNPESYYRQISDEFIKTQEQKHVLKEAKKRFALAFVYLSDCPSCQRQLPALLSLKEDIGITLLGISVDGGIYPGLDQVITDREALKDPKIQGFPTLMLVDSKTNKRLFISRGITPNSRLQKLIYKKIKEVAND